MAERMVLEALVGVAAVALAILAVVRLVGRGGPWSIADLLAPRWDLPWPRGVQEEEPHIWDLHALDASAERARVGRIGNGPRSAPDRLVSPGIRARRPRTTRRSR